MKQLVEDRKVDTAMKAMVYLGPGKRAWQDRPRPKLLEAGDAIVRISTTTICGSDLHILKGDVPAAAHGLILGHEGVGVVEEVGSSVLCFRKGDRVIISCITSCGRCSFCRRGTYSHCLTGGWILGHKIDGTQAEYVRIPYADSSLYALPAKVDEEAGTMLSDILPTGHECGVINGKVKPGDVVAIVGAGPVGLSALLTAQLYSPIEIILVDMDANRLEVALSLGATKVIDSSDGNAAKKIMDLTGGAGVDVAIEAVGIEATFNICQSILAPGGHLANIGVHGKPVQLNMDKLWSQNITLTTRLVDTITTPMLLRMVESGRLDATKLVSHRFKLSDMMEAYDTFGNASKKGALKVLLSND